MSLTIDRSFLFLCMQKALFCIPLLLVMVLTSCHEYRNNSFVPLNLVGPETTQVISLSSGSMLPQGLRQQKNINPVFNLPKFPAFIDSLVMVSNGRGNSVIIIDNPDTQTEPTEAEPASYVLITRSMDSVQAPPVETFVHHGDTVFVFSKNQYTLYSSRNNLGNRIKQAPNQEVNGLVKMFELNENKPLLIAKKLGQSTPKISLNKPSWIIYAPQFNAVERAVHGVIIPAQSDSLLTQKHLLETFELNQKPSVLMSPEVFPLGISSSLSLALNNPQALSSKMQTTDSSFVLNPFLETVNEVSLVELEQSKALVFKSLDLDMSLGTMTPNWESSDNFRGIEIKSFENEGDLIYPLSFMFDDIPKMTQFFVWDTFLILTPTREIAQEYITQLQNKNTLSRSGIWTALEENIARESSLLSWNFDAPNKATEVLQLVEDRGFTHINYAQQIGDQEVINSTEGALMRSIQLNAPLAQAPQFFTNHKTGGKNIVVQDENYRLYFIAPSGNVLWYRDLQESILGPIQEVDILRNGKKQLAFVTRSKWYVIDRNGRNVNAFPKKFRDDITQPLAIFDYDNNRKYRFVIIQDRSVFMYDAKGKRVKGFTYTKAPSQVIQAPTHIRINNKDYLLFLLEDGRLQILSRTGKIRIPISEQFDFGDQAPIKHDGKIVFWTRQGSQIQISQSGTVVKLSAKSPSQYRLVYKGVHTIEFDDPLLRIDQHLIELPLGNYSGPQVFKFGKRLRTVMIDNDTQNVYLYNSEGRLLENLPVFGRSLVDLADINNDGSLELVVQGQDQEVLLYTLN